MAVTLMKIIINHHHCRGPKGMTVMPVSVSWKERSTGVRVTQMWYLVYVLQIMEMWEHHSVSYHHRTVKQISFGFNFCCFKYPLLASQLWMHQSIKWLLHFSLLWFCLLKDRGPFVKGCDKYCYEYYWIKSACIHPGRGNKCLCKFWQIFKCWQLPDSKLTPYLSTLWAQVCQIFGWRNL